MDDDELADLYARLTLHQAVLVDLIAGAVLWLPIIDRAAEIQRLTRALSNKLSLGSEGATGGFAEKVKAALPAVAAAFLSKVQTTIEQAEGDEAEEAEVPLSRRGSTKLQ